MNEDLILQMRVQLWDLMYHDWLVEIYSVKFLSILTFIFIYYVIWWKLTDKRRISDLLLFGSFLSIIALIIDMYGVASGLWYYTYRILPIPVSIFLHDLTLSPLTYMLALQYSSSWKKYLVNGLIAAVFIHAILLTSLKWFGIYHPVSWSLFQGIMTSYIAGILSRAAFHLVKQVQNKAIQGNPLPMQSTLIQPAFKKIDEEEKDPSK